MNDNQKQAAALEVVKRDDGWWVTNHEPEMGPYDTKREAQEDRSGVQKFYRREL